jgi:hypothetical protein
VHAGKDAQSAVDRCVIAIGVHSLAVIAYCCLFGLLGIAYKRSLLLGIVYIAVVEGLFANMAFSIRLITVIYYARVIAYRTMPFVFMDGPRQENIAADAWQLDPAHDPQLLEHPTTATCLIILISASVILALAGAFICWRKEFHVKTPEKN